MEGNGKSEDYIMRTLYQATNWFNKVKQKKNRKIPLMTFIKLLHVSAPVCNSQGFY